MPQPEPETPVTLHCPVGGRVYQITEEELDRQRQWVKAYVESKLKSPWPWIRWYWNVRLRQNPFIQAPHIGQKVTAP